MQVRALCRLRSEDAASISSEQSALIQFQAYDICRKRDLVREQVFILGRMGNSKKALDVIINKLGDIEEVGMLLEHTVGNLDPLYIVNKVPDGLEIPRLRDRLVKIITDYRTETSLRHGCNDILKADCVNLLVKYYKATRHAVYLSNEEDEKHAKRDDKKGYQDPAKLSTVRAARVKSKTMGSARCCICFDPFSVRNISVVVFFCCHSYHTSCLMDSTYTASSQKSTKEASSNGASEFEYQYEEEDDDDNNDNAESGGNRLRCILCTTAAG